MIGRSPRSVIHYILETNQWIDDEMNACILLYIFHTTHIHNYIYIHTIYFYIYTYCIWYSIPIGRIAATPQLRSCQMASWSSLSPTRTMLGSLGFCGHYWPWALTLTVRTPQCWPSVGGMLNQCVCICIHTHPYIHIYNFIYIYVYMWLYVCVCVLYQLFVRLLIYVYLVRWIDRYMDR